MRVDTAFEYLRHAYECGRFISGGLLIVGDVRGSADRLATKIIQLLFCAEAARPCGACTACRQAADKTTFDAVWVEPEMKSRQIGVDQVRERLINVASQTSLMGGWKAGVIIQADRMTPQAANAFLKTLEEPPPQTVFLLLAESAQNLLPTVISRCQRIDVSDDAPAAPPPWQGELLSMLAGISAAGPVAAMAAAAQVCALLAELKQEAENSVKNDGAADASAVETSTEELDARIQSRYREGRQAILGTLQCWYRDMLAIRCGGDVQALFFPQHLANLQSRASNLSVAQAMGNIDAIDGMRRQLERNMAEASVLAYWFDRINNGLTAGK